MSRKSNSKRRREANRRLPTFGGSNFTLNTSRRLVNTQVMGWYSTPNQKTRWEPSSKLSTYLKNASRLRSVSQQVITPSTPKTKPYRQPNWSPVNQKKIEQPSAVRKSLCASRAERKQIMFATRKAGKAGQKTPVWTELSRKKCK